MQTSAAPRWLTAEQQRTWRAYLEASAHIDRYLEEGLRPFGLGMSEYEILVNLSEAPGRRMRMSDLADASRQSRSRLTHTVARMEKKGLLTRLPCPGDRRGVIAQLNPDGWDLLDSAAPDHVASVREILIDVVDPEDLDALGRVMNAVNRAAEHATGPAS
ncbi:MAG: MarR family transcriptional regulator [Propioniciclava sp.]|uniref:MarR family winged helix-turn-helix transcriptional regulator n=1 Tax=Propioniciclava sp. TaxID=2038686 RepID=UPI0039E31D6D